MAYAASGTYTLPSNSFASPTTGDVLSPTNAITTHTDFQTAFNVISAIIGAGATLTVTPRNMHTGSNPAMAAADGTNLDVVVTELYVAEVFIPCNVTVTGVSVFQGTNTNGNMKVMLFSAAGTRVAISASTSVAADASDAYGARIPFTGSTYAAKGPATYYVGVICDDNTHDINTHVVGNFGAGKITGLVYATESGYATISAPSTFLTGLGPIASLY